MAPPFRQPVENAAAALRDGADGGLPVLIPGALEARGARSGGDVAGAVRAATSAGHPRGRLEYQREGGGAPSERRHQPHRALLVRVMDWLLRRDRESNGST